MTRTNKPAAARGSAAPRKLEIGVLYGFRALMVLAVVNYHIWQQSWLSQRVTCWGCRWIWTSSPVPPTFLWTG